MAIGKEERRRGERIFFSDSGEITAMFHLCGHDEKRITAHIMDLCEEGIGLSLTQRDQSEFLAEDDRLLLTEIKGSDDVQFLMNIEVEVRWILNVKHIAVGCEFLNVSQAFREQLQQFMESQRQRV